LDEGVGDGRKEAQKAHNVNDFVNLVPFRGYENFICG
jgi:hypothetical protein